MPIYKYYTAKTGKAFEGDSKKSGYKARVNVNDSVVEVWDDVAEHYTTCHSLTDKQIRHIIVMAK